MLGFRWTLTALTLAPLLACAEGDTKTTAANVPGSAIANMLQEHDTPFMLYPYETNYIIYTYTDKINKKGIASYDWAEDAKKDEMKFQISLGFPIWRGVLGNNSLLGASYTQVSLWQAFNRGASSPFRETNYEPQLFLAWATDYDFLGWTLREVEIGGNHQSNGRSDPTSRSWNRVYGRVMAQNGNWQVDLKPWYRLPESKADDDNRDITKYLGYYRLKVGYKLGESVLSVNSRYNWNTGYGGADVGLSYPLTPHVRLYTQVFSGYGESLIDYNYRQTRIGFGVMLNDIM